MIRRPVARTAPILLLPSYLKMDRNYRQAISKVFNILYKHSIIITTNIKL
jgi:hypothetical protein